MSNFLKNHNLIVALNPFSTGASATTLAGNIIDMSGYEGCCFVGVAGNSTSSQTVLVQGSATTATTDFQNLSGCSAASTSSNGNIVVDVHKPLFQYLRAVVTSTGTANVLAPLAVQYGPIRKGPITQSTSHVVASTLVAGAAT